MLECIDRSAFVRSPLPIILMLDMHCSPPFQRRIAEHIEDVFGRRLLRPTADRAAPTTDGALPLPLY